LQNSWVLRQGVREKSLRPQRLAHPGSAKLGEFCESGLQDAECGMQGPDDFAPPPPSGRRKTIVCLTAERFSQARLTSG
jgi:hypothetical protein